MEEPPQIADNRGRKYLTTGEHASGAKAGRPDGRAHGRADRRPDARGPGAPATDAHLNAGVARIRARKRREVHARSQDVAPLARSVARGRKEPLGKSSKAIACRKAATVTYRTGTDGPSVRRRLGSRGGGTRTEPGRRPHRPAASQPLPCHAENPHGATSSPIARPDRPAPPRKSPVPGAGTRKPRGRGPWARSDEARSG